MGINKKREEKNMNVLKLVTLLCFLCTAVPLSAKKGFAISERLVRISQKHTKVFRTGFLVNYKGEAAVICTQSAFLPEVTIEDHAGNKLSFSKVLIPAKAEKSNILILILEDQKPLSKCLIMNKNIEQTIKTGEKIDVQGYSQEKQQLYAGEGKVTKIEERQINIVSKVHRDVTGAPVISSKNKQLLGVAFCKKRGKVEMPYAERIDNITNFAILTADDVAAEESDLLSLSSSVIHYSQTFRKIKGLLDKMHYTEDNMDRLKVHFKKLSQKEKKALKEELTGLNKELKKIATELKRQQTTAAKRKDIIIPSFIQLFNANQMRANEIIERKCKPNAEMLTQVLEAIDGVF